MSETKKRWMRGIGIWLFVVVLVALVPINDSYERKLTRDVFSGEEAICLYPGTYELVVDYASPDKEVKVHAIDVKAINEDHSQGALIFDETLPATEDSKELIYFEIPEDVTMAKVHFYSEELTDEDLTIFGLRLNCTERMYRDKEFLVCATAVIGLVLLWYCMRHRFTKEEMIRHLLLLGSVLVVSKVLAMDYIPKGHDLMIHFNRIDGLKEGLKAGYFPVRIYPNLMNDYGYAFPTFYPDLFLFIPALLGVCGVSVFTGYKVLILMIHVATAYIGYASFTRLTGSRKTGTIAAVLYTLSLYRLTDVYTRAALGESLAMTFLPLWLMAVKELFAGDRKKWIWSVVSLTCLLRSHLLTAEMVVIITAVMALVHIRSVLEKKRFLTIVIAGGCTVLLNLGFLVPFLHHMDGNYNVFVEASRRLSESVLQVSTVFSFMVENAVATESDNPIFNWALGGALIFGCIALLAALIKRGKEKVPHYALVTLGLGLLFVYMSTNCFPWDLVYEIKGIRELTSIIQFPWRLLGFASLYLSISAAYGYELVFEGELAKLFIPLALAFAVFCAVIHLDQFYDDAAPLIYKNSAPFWSTYQVDDLYLMDRKTMGSYYRRDNLIEPEDPSKEIVISNYHNKNLVITFDYETDQEQRLNLPLVYDKNYRAYDGNGTLLNTYIGGSGRLGLHVNAGTGYVRVAYEEHVAYKAADLLQSLTLVGLIGYVLLRRRKERRAGGSV